MYTEFESTSDKHFAIAFNDMDSEKNAVILFSNIQVNGRQVFKSDNLQFLNQINRMDGELKTLRDIFKNLQQDEENVFSKSSVNLLSPDNSSIYGSASLHLKTFKNQFGFKGHPKMHSSDNALAEPMSSYQNS